MPEARRARLMPASTNLHRMVTGIVAGMVLQSALPMVEAQDYELVPPVESQAAPQMGQGISIRARIAGLYFPPGGSEPILVQRAFTTSAATDQSSQYVFDVLNDAALDGVNQALAGGATAGRVSVVAMCYAYGRDNSGAPSMLPMGLFINTTDMNVLPDGKASVHSNIRIVPPNAH